MSQPPSGTVTFLFTDIEGSTRSWEEHPDEMRRFVAEHDARFRAAIEENNGYVVKGTGDGVHAAFGRAADAIAAAEQCQAAIADLPDLKVRMGINTGEVQERDGDYFGPAVNRAARLMDAGHGGQVLIAAVTADLVPGVVMRNLGEHRLRDLGGPVVVWQLGSEDFPPLRTLDQLPGNLPVQLTSFVGRAEEVKVVAELVAAHRLVTLTGVGGVGKTRLATQVAADLADRFADGVWLVELASIDAPRIIGAVARVLSVEVRPGASLEESLLDAIGSRELLLVLDNCEHVVREVRRVANELLRSARGAAILATSREGLRVDGEQLFTVPSLDDDASARLFVERAREADSAFELDETGVRVVAELCERLDGVPLAIELAAARARMFSVAELARRVEQRFRLLTGGRGDVERHQTLRAAIDWSYDLLEPTERVALARMSVFAGGATLEAVESVVADDETSADHVVDMVASLVDKSLVLADRSHAESRYEMLETIRQYAQERLVESGDAEAVRARHAQWFAGFARRAGRGLYSADELMWDERLRPEVDNLQFAVAWAVGAGETDAAMRIGGSFPRGAVTRPLLGTAHLAEVALQVEGADAHPAYTRVLAEAGWAAATRGDRDLAFELLNRSIDAQRAGGRFAAAAFTYLLTGTWASATWQHRLEFAAEGLVLAEAAGDRVAATGSRITYASMLAMCDRPVDASAHARHALDDARALRQPTLEAAALFACAQAQFGSEPAEAITLLREALETARRHHSEAEEGSILGLLAYVEARDGDAREALEAIRGKALWEIRNPRTSMAPYFLGTGAFSRVGRPDLVALCEGNSRTTVLDGSALTALWGKLHEEEIGEARTTLGDERFEELAARGAATAPEDFHPMLIAEIDETLDQMD
jgi:predicted ATPase